MYSYIALATRDESEIIIIMECHTLLGSINPERFSRYGVPI